MFSFGEFVLSFFSSFRFQRVLQSAAAPLQSFQRVDQLLTQFEFIDDQVDELPPHKSVRLALNALLMVGLLSLRVSES